jgi:hypothetical protein
VILQTQMTDKSKTTESKVRDYCRLNTFKAFARVCAENDRLNLVRPTDARLFLENMRSHEAVNICLGLSGAGIGGLTGYKLAPKRSLGGFLMTSLCALIGMGLAGRFENSLDKSHTVEMSNIISHYGDWPSNPAVVNTLSKTVR